MGIFRLFILFEQVCTMATTADIPGDFFSICDSLSVLDAGVTTLVGSKGPNRRS